MTSRTGPTPHRPAPDGRGGRHRAEPVTDPRLPGRAVGAVLLGVTVVFVVVVGLLLAGRTQNGPPADASSPTAAAVTAYPTSPSSQAVDIPSGVPTISSSGATPSATDPDAVPGPAVDTGPSAGSDEAPRPVSLQVPAIEVDLDSLDALGLQDDGSIEVPADAEDAGWLTASAVPGRTGPAVIAGHVDSATGPAVFSRLGELGAGDEVTVGLDDGTVVRYVVGAVDRYLKSQFPTETVYGPSPVPVLRLLTCGGTFDRGEGSYEDNVVVYATLAS